MSDTRMTDAPETILDAARTLITERGLSGVSTREVAKLARMPLSQIHYHFGSKQGLIIALFEHSNAQLLERQKRLFSNTAMPVAEQWDMACTFLDEDLASGYVRTLMELWAQGWSDPDIAQVVRSAITGWLNLILGVARRAEDRFGALGPFTAESLSALVGSAFIGAEAFLLLDFDAERVPVRRALGEIGDLIRQLEAAAE